MGMRFGRRNKYGATPTEVDGIRFPSMREANRWRELCILERAGVISGLERQCKYPLRVNGELIGTYTCDFRYVENGETVVEDVKGYKGEREYKRTKKLVKALYGFVIREA